MKCKECGNKMDYKGCRVNFRDRTEHYKCPKCEYVDHQRVLYGAFGF